MAPHKKFTNQSTTNKKTIQEYIKFKRIEKPELSNRTTRNIQETLENLADHLKNKKFTEANTQTMQQFFESKSHQSWRTRDTYGMHIIPFYRWLHNIDQHSRPENMKWFKTTPQKTIRRKKDIHEKETQFIKPEEYEKMLTWGNDQYGQINAIWETYYLAGIRPEELPSMKIKDIENKDGITTVIISDSKTIPRKIPLPHTPYKLLEYLENHPQKNNEEAYLWFSFKNTFDNTPLGIDAIRTRFRAMKHDLKLTPTLTIKSFRKTRATIVFATQHHHNLTLKQIGQLFGWTLKTVVEREEEYSLTDQEDLIKQYCMESYIEPTPKQLKKENIELRKMEEQIKNLESVITKLSLQEINGELYRFDAEDERYYPIYPKNPDTPWLDINKKPIYPEKRIFVNEKGTVTTEHLNSKGKIIKTKIKKSN